MMASPALVIVNPVSGTRSKQGLEEAVHRLMGAKTEIIYTEYAGHAALLAAQAANAGIKQVVAAGGDGTVNEIARSLTGTETALGIIPQGSGNGLARHLQIPVDIAMALKVIADGNVVDSDYGTVNGRPFFCTFGMGFDAAVSHRFARQSRRGILSYVKSAISEYVQYRPQTYTVSANGKLLTEKAFLIAVCNASQWGNNAYIAPEASITDGLLDITIVHSGTAIDAAVMGMDIFTGYINKNTMVHTFRAPACVIYRNGAGEAHIDGEPMMMDDILDVKCHHGALKVFTPGATHRFTPVITPLQEMFKGARLSIKHLLGSR